MPRTEFETPVPAVPIKPNSERLIRVGFIQKDTHTRGIIELLHSLSFIWRSRVRLEPVTIPEADRDMIADRWMLQKRFPLTESEAMKSMANSAMILSERREENGGN